jgi:pilus assembly protein CpaB
MKPARLVVLFIALAAGGVAAWLASSSRQPEQQVQAPAIDTVDVLVAKADLDRGQVIAAENIGWQAWPTGALNPSFIKRTDRPDAVNQFTGAIVRVSIASGEPIREPNVVFAKAGGFLSAVLTEGMRAVAMEITPENGAGGFILPDDHVDIILTHRDKEAERDTGVEKYVSETILRNVRVLAVDQAVDEKSGQKVALGKTATVELTPDQAETLALSRQLGSLSLALRSIVDSPSTTPENAREKQVAQFSINTVRYGVSSSAMTR